MLYVTGLFQETHLLKTNSDVAKISHLCLIVGSEFGEPKVCRNKKSNFKIIALIRN